MSCSIHVYDVPLENSILCGFVRYHVVWGLIMLTVALIGTCCVVIYRPEGVDYVWMIILWCQVFGIEVGLPAFCLHLLHMKKGIIYPAAEIVQKIPTGVVDLNHQNSSVDHASVIPVGFGVGARKNST
jgi:hypothetical protein